MPIFLVVLSILSTNLLEQVVLEGVTKIVLIEIQNLDGVGIRAIVPVTVILPVTINLVMSR